MRQAGYTVAFRTATWSECFVQRGPERWVGRGSDDDDALGRALDQMLPSHLVRSAALSRLLQDDAGTSVMASNAVTLTSDATAAATPTAAHRGASPEDVTATGVAADVSTHEDAVPVAPAVAPPTAPECSTLTRLAKDATPKPEAHPDRADGPLAAIDLLLVEIDARAAACARLAPVLMRGWLTAWMCRARAVEEAHPGDRAVERAAQAVAARLTEFAKANWPGSVNALQIATRPAQIGPTVPADAPPRSWAEAAVVAHRHVERELAQARARGADADGWLDSVACMPPPRDPDGLLREVERDLAPFDVTATPTREQIDLLLGLARKLRWLRLTASDGRAWGAAIGRVRRLAARGSEAEIAALRLALDAACRPTMSWAALCLTEPKVEPTPAAQAEALRVELPKIAGDATGLLRWLVRAFDVFGTPELAALVAPYAGRVVGLEAEAAEHDDRRVRRRMRDLVAKLGAGEPGRREHGLAAAAPAAVPTRDDDADEALAADGDPLLGRVRRVTEGRRVLFVSNRTDPALEAKLMSMLGISLTGCEGSLRRVQAQCIRIGSGAYDMVFSATGFQEHGTDAALYRACKPARVPYIRVDRGRPLACVQAIAREFGLAEAR
jgi:hypothetical protein